MKQSQKLSPPQIHRSLALKILSVFLFVISIGNITFSSRETNTIEVSLEYLLGNLETWGSWFDPNNEIGLLPEAEGRFIIPNAPILQAGGTTLSGNIGVMGFAQPIIINENGIPKGFNENEHFYEPFPINYNDSIEDIFQKVPYLDRFTYQYGVQVNGRIVQIYRKPIEKEFTLLNMLQTMGTPPEIAEAWIKEYVKVAHLPQTLQLAWLIAENPLAEDYQSHIEYILAGANLSALFIPNSKIEGLPSPQVPNAQLANQDPFWAEVQKQPLMTAFTELLSDASEDVKRSFIVSLFFLPPTLPIPQEANDLGILVLGSSNNSTGALRKNNESMNNFDGEKDILGHIEGAKGNSGSDSIAIVLELEFKTERLLVRSWQNYASTISDENAFAERIISILTPEVTKALPERWQGIDTIEKANEWIKARNEDSEVFTIQYAPENLVVGFLFLNGEYSSDPNLIDLRLGYLFSEEVWGKGLGSELIKGLVEWCEKAGNISSISGGVEISNKASIRVLEKNGFSILPLDEPQEGMIFLERKFKPIN